MAEEQEQDKNKRIRPREQARGQKVAKLSKPKFPKFVCGR